MIRNKTIPNFSDTFSSLFFSLSLNLLFCLISFNFNFNRDRREICQNQKLYNDGNEYQCYMRQMESNFNNVPERVREMRQLYLRIN